MSARGLVRAAALGGAAVAVGVWVSGGRGRSSDAEAFVVANRDRGPVADGLFRGITELGSIWASVGAAVILAGLGRRRAAARGLAAASADVARRPGAEEGLRPPPTVRGRPRGNAAADRRVRPRRRGRAATRRSSSSFTSVAGRELGAGGPARAALDALAAARRRLPRVRRRALSGGRRRRTPARQGRGRRVRRPPIDSPAVTQLLARDRLAHPRPDPPVRRPRDQPARDRHRGRVPVRRMDPDRTRGRSAACRSSTSTR